MALHMHQYSWARFCVTRQLRIQHHQLLPTFKLFYEEIVVAVKNIVNIISHTFLLSIFVYSWYVLQFFVIMQWIFCTNLLFLFYEFHVLQQHVEKFLFVLLFWQRFIVSSFIFDWTQTAVMAHVPSFWRYSDCGYIVK